MQMQATDPASPLQQLERAVESEAGTVAGFLSREAAVPEEVAQEAASAVRREAWSAALALVTLEDGSALFRRAGLRAAAATLRRHGPGGASEEAAIPIPEGLTVEALRGAMIEVIPGRRSVVGLHLRGYRADEMRPLYDLDEETMRDRLDQALENFRASLHRRAERMNQEAWSRALEATPVLETRGMLREHESTVTSRLQCTAPSDLAEAVNGTHFRGGREAALDHASVCNPCARELRVLLGLRGERRHGQGLSLEGNAMEEARRRARSRPDLRPLLTLPAAAVRSRRTWLPWVLLLAAGSIALLIFFRWTG